MKDHGPRRRLVARLAMNMMSLGAKVQVGFGRFGRR